MNIFLQKRFYVSAAFAAVLGLTSCSSDDDVNGNGNTDTRVGTGSEHQYIVAASSENTSYLLAKDDITEGELSIKGDGLQVVGSPIWYFYNDVALFSYIYNQGDPGTTKSFDLNGEGYLRERNELNLQTSIQSRGIVGDEMYLQFSSRNYENPIATFYKVNGRTQNVDGPIEVNTADLAGNGEIAYITDIAESNDQVLVGYRTIIAGADGNDDRSALFNSDYNDRTQLAVLNKDLELQQRIIDSTGRTGMIGGQVRSQGETGIEPVENGDIYVFSSAAEADDVPSGVLKINNGQMKFDENYFFNISEASEGYKLFRSFYVGNNVFVLQMFSDPNTANANADTAKSKFAVVNVVNKSFDWVEEGLPQGITGVGNPYIDAENNEVVFPISTAGNPQLFILDATTHKMTAGTTIEAETVNAVGKLSIQ